LFCDDCVTGGLSLAKAGALKSKFEATSRVATVFLMPEIFPPVYSSFLISFIGSLPRTPPLGKPPRNLATSSNFISPTSRS